MKETEESRDEISSLNEDEDDIDSPTIQSNIKTESQDENLIQVYGNLSSLISQYLQCALCDGQFNSVALLQMHTITFHIPTVYHSLRLPLIRFHISPLYLFNHSFVLNVILPFLQCLHSLFI